MPPSFFLPPTTWMPIGTYLLTTAATVSRPPSRGFVAPLPAAAEVLFLIRRAGRNVTITGRLFFPPKKMVM